MKYFLYARKSTDTEDKQVLSIQSQLTEVREYAKKENLVIVQEFQEAKTAKSPGRPIFNEMIKRIEKGEASGIIAWHPDRLARNSIDGGKIIYLVDTGDLLNLLTVLTTAHKASSCSILSLASLNTTLTT
jgi:DNA invertase Pin-like site-specific DNA recombinase